ncbi:hypothetical protein G3545_14665 [Starkeya sp. ORNL1]|uniref:Bug family tripartite tricarboxylate transporter substrate binding protein n=1 Tax=Starkeya sp. ORNL1 TaxID=2709380 RepID=UPI001463BFC7|nr:tripartite tricarboxylate transporter substrate-binding protein [Starkeya sp. ORNL1]QJP14778.1 hypothetical protein G3545_14665 [Starkeya sp. ORNL1]
MRRFALPLVASLAVVTGAAGNAQADDACAFFKNKTVELIVPFSPGGGFDVYGRMVAKFMGGELGAANMIVRNQPGAGGLLGTNQTWKAKPDGLRIQLMSASGMVTSELGGADGVEFKSGEFSWIGRVSGEPDVIATSPGSPVKTVEDLKKLGTERKVRIGSSGVGDIDYIEASLLTKVLELNADVITGFSGAPEVYASLGRGELDLFSSSLSAAQVAEKAGTARILWAYGTGDIPGEMNVKSLSDVVDAKHAPMVKAQSDVVAAGRSLAGPPKIPEDRLKCLRDAFDRTMASAPLLEESKKLNRPVAPLSGQQIAGLIRGVTEGAPKDYLELLRKSYGK